MSLEQFLKAEAEKFRPGILSDDNHYVRFHEDVNPDALDGDKWLKTNTSYIWKVGVLLLIDNNKCDWVHVFIGHERAPGKLEFIGKLYFSDGENDDMGRSMKRYLECAAAICPAFDTHDE